MSKTLAYISGNYKATNGGKSLLTGQERFLTLEMKSHNGHLPKGSCRNILDRGWSGRIADSIKNIKSVRGGQSAVFDINESDYSRFMEIFDCLVKEQGRSIDFQVKKCQELPELEDENNGGSYGVAPKAGFNNNRGYESKSRSYGGARETDYSRSREPQGY